MSLDQEQIRRQIEQALGALTESRGEEMVHKIRQIALTNLEKGRIHAFIDRTSEGVQTYIQLVDQLFVHLHEYLHQLQFERSREVWQPLFEHMQHWAYSFLLGKGFVPGSETRETAIECATEAAVNLLGAYFPYDTAFDAWVIVIVQNTCRKYIQRALKKSVVPEDKKVELDDNLLSPSELLFGDHVFQSESRQELEAALAKLSDTRQAVIRMIYLEDRKPAEIALLMGKSASAVYDLRFRALGDLRKIFSTTRDNINEREP